jgi:2-iminobutanoate/2-iminopropanoate deaminase
MKTLAMVALACVLVGVMSCDKTAPEGGQALSQKPEFLNVDTSSTLPFSEAVRVGNVLYLSGMIGAADGKIVPGGIEAETKQAMDNIREILERNGSSMDRVFRCMIAIADIKDWPAMNKVYASYFSHHNFPARTTFGANGLVLGAKLEIECWATVK